MRRKVVVRKVVAFLEFHELRPVDVDMRHYTGNVRRDAFNPTLVAHSGDAYPSVPKVKVSSFHT
jgi:hypothetical protein